MDNAFLPRRARRAALIIAGVAGMVLTAPAYLAAQTPDASDIAEGARLFRQKGNCQSCHGWAGDGRKMDSQMPDGANLRVTRLDRAALIMTIKCGLPGTGMPPFDRFAYSDGRCYGLKQADLAKAGTAHVRSAGDAAEPRDRIHCGFHVRQDRRQRADGPRQMRGILGPGERACAEFPK